MKHFFKVRNGENNLTWPRDGLRGHTTPDPEETPLNNSCHVCFMSPTLLLLLIQFISIPWHKFQAIEHCTILLVTSYTSLSPNSPPSFNGSSRPPERWWTTLGHQLSEFTNSLERSPNDGETKQRLNWRSSIHPDSHWVTQLPRHVTRSWWRSHCIW